MIGGRASKRMGDRAVYCARLESVCAERHPGFESPPIRHARVTCEPTSFSSLAAIKHRKVLPQFDNAAVGQNAAKIHARINHAIVAQDRARVNYGVAANLRSIADDRAEFCQSGCDIAVGCNDGNIAMIEFYVRENHACAEMSVVSKD